MCKILLHYIVKQSFRIYQWWASVGSFLLRWSATDDRPRSWCFQLYTKQRCPQRRRPSLTTQLYLYKYAINKFVFFKNVHSRSTCAVTMCFCKLIFYVIEKIWSTLPIYVTVNNFCHTRWQCFKLSTTGRARAANSMTFMLAKSF